MAATWAVAVGVDGRSGSAGALRYALAEAARRDVGVRLVHVIPGSVPRSLASRTGPRSPEELAGQGWHVLAAAREAAREIDPRPPVTTVLARGGRAGELVRAARCADTLVLGQGSRAGHPWRTSLVGDVLPRSVVPVVVVPPGWHGDQTGQLLLGIRSAEQLGPGLDAVLAAAEDRGGHVVVLQTCGPAHLRARVDEGAETVRQRERRLTEQLEALTSPWQRRHAGVALEVVVRHECAAPALVAWSRAVDEVVLVRSDVSNRGRGVGAMIPIVLSRASCPVRVLTSSAGASGPGDVR